MFKNAGDKTHYLNRTGSHATKEHATGRIDALPKWAREPEEYFNSLLARYLSLKGQSEHAQSELEKINFRLKTTLAKREYDHLHELKQGHAQRFHALMPELVQYRAMVREAAAKSWATTFFHLARTTLDKAQFIQLCEAAEAMLGRQEAPIGPGQAEMSEGKRDAIRRRFRRQEFRQSFTSRKTGADQALVYSDEKGIKPAHVPPMEPKR